MIKNLYGFLRDNGNNVEIADFPSVAIQMVLNKEYDSIIIDSEPFGLSSEDAIRIIKTILPDVLIIFVGYPRFNTDAVTIETPVDLEEFKQTVKNPAAETAGRRNFEHLFSVSFPQVKRAGNPSERFRTCRNDRNLEPVAETTGCYNYQ